jgi:hypothetical protein
VLQPLHQPARSSPLSACQYSPNVGPQLLLLLLLFSPRCSVLEPGRSLTLAEKGGGGAELVVGAAGFQVLGTMNPGGDFGKKELSPALSNRFTQVGGCCACMLFACVRV